VIDNRTIMLRCISLAERATGYTKTNPRVGCIIMWESTVLAEGWHQKFGEMHAEAHALSLITPENEHLLPMATLYVTLEPCNHFGKTPPCSHAIVQSGIKKVIVGCVDPNPLVSGQGIQYLRDAGIEVIIGIEKTACEELIRPYVVAMEKKRPYIILKWAQSADGFIGKENESVWLSNPWSKRQVHKIRSEVDGILVGAGTIEADNPELNTRFDMGRSPIKIVLDSAKGLSSEHAVFRSESKTVLISSHTGQLNDSNHPEIISVAESPTKNMASWLEELKKRDIGSILVEGGSRVLQTFIDKGFWDEAIRINCPIFLQSGIKAPELKHVRLKQITNLEGDVWHYFLNVNTL
jgi:diaminohydroxyphosphoribosylaminopyrimidine deaminase/5-amino-6-(5-phosphoribosylamino)uracil reductase